MDRRTFLKLAAAAGLAAPTGLWPRRANAAEWGELPAGVLDQNYVPPRILEIYLYGGLSPWETFYVSTNGMGAPAKIDKNNAGTRLNAFRIERQAAALEGFFNPLREADDPNHKNSPLADPLEIGPLQNGKTLYWGRATSPLWGRPYPIRLVTMRHEFPAHQGAIPLALTGRRLGRPTMAGLGAAIEHRHQIARANTNIPKSYVILPGSVDATYFGAAVAVGLHPGDCRPVLINLADSNLGTLLSRPGQTDPTQFDALLLEYRRQYAKRVNGLGSAAFEEYWAVRDEAHNHVALKGVVDGALATVVNGNEAVHWGSVDGMGNFTPENGRPNATHSGINMAISLFDNADARYVCVVDAGMYQVNGGSGYDTHSGHALPLSANLWNTLHYLDKAIQDGKINLNNTLIFLNTEFGRKTQADKPTQSPNGRDHHPDGYVVALIGNMLNHDLMNGQKVGVVGAIDDDGKAMRPASIGANLGIDALDPSHLHAALLVAAGIDPFAIQNFAVGQFDAFRDLNLQCNQPCAIEDAAAVAYKILGLPKA